VLVFFGIKNKFGILKNNSYIYINKITKKKIMAKEYYGLKTQQISFDTEAFTMTIISTDPHFKNVAIHTMPENMFNSQYLMFKANMFRGLSTKESGITPTDPQDKMALESLPHNSTVEDFIIAKNATLGYLNDTLANI
jgi:hypothetical protein